MKTTIEVADANEARQLKDGLSDKTVRAFVRIVGVLGRLKNDRARKRVMNYVWDCLEEEAGR